MGLIKKTKRIFKIIILRLVLFPYFIISSLYWGIVKSFAKIWAWRGLHAISVGDFTGGRWKKRSIYRQEMLLRAIPLFVDLQSKSCLDLGCNDGFWSFRLGQFGIEKLIGIDTDYEYRARFNFLKTVYNFKSFKYKRADIFNFLYNENEDKYDIILFLGLLYHLPENSNWDKFFQNIYQINNYCLIIDTRWFDNDDYWYDKTSGQAIIKTDNGIIKKWRPTRSNVFDYLHKSGYEQILEINPISFLTNQKEAYGNGNPYTRENVSDYITNNRSLIIAYKEKSMIPDIKKRASFKVV